MGMAASQARFLSLTARKSNVEYEGQQVNQQRTALANESANLYNKLTSIKVPTPPSTSDFYETVYTFKAADLDKSNLNSTEYTLLDILTLPDGNYAKLEYLAYQWEAAVTSAYQGSINTKFDEKTGETKYSVSLVNGTVADATEYTYEPSQNDVMLDFSKSNEVYINGIAFQLDPTGSQILGDPYQDEKDPSKILYKYVYDVKHLGNDKYSLKLDIKVDNDLSNKKETLTFTGASEVAGKKQIVVDGITYTLDKENKKITDNRGYEYEILPNDEDVYEIILPKTYSCEVAGQKYEAKLQSDGTYKCIIPGATPDQPLESSVSGRYIDSEGKVNSAISYLGESFTSYRQSYKDEQGQIATQIFYNQPILAYEVNKSNYFISAKEYDYGRGREFSSSSYVQNVGHPAEIELPCQYSTASTGRYKTLTVTDEDGYQHTYELKVTSIQDEEAYEQAMMDYEYEQARYSKQVADINAKTEALQKEDRTLELRLKQLDTEQNAIKTEMDAVSKVIEDNIEATFKTFA